MKGSRSHDLPRFTATNSAIPRNLKKLKHNNKEEFSTISAIPRRPRSLKGRGFANAVILTVFRSVKLLTDGDRERVVNLADVICECSLDQ